MSKASNKLSTLAQLVEKKKQAENDKLKVYTWHDDINDITFTFNKCDMDMLLELTEKYPKAFESNGKQNIEEFDELVRAFEELIFKLLIIDNKKLNDTEVQDFLLGEKKATIMPSELQYEVVKAIMIDKIQILSLGGAILEQSNVNMKKLDNKVENAKN